MADTRRTQLHKCNICGNIVEIYHRGRQNLACCDQPIELLNENTTDASKEKHVPVIERNNDGIKVTVGEVEHPMTEKHYIQWIELLTDHRVYTRFLNPEEPPEAFFRTDAIKVRVRAYCNIHGLWKNEN